MRMFPSEISVWIHQLSTAGCSPQCERASPHALKVWIENIKVGEGRSYSAWLLSWAISYLPLAVISALWTCTGTYTTRSPGSPACRQQTVTILSLHNCLSEFLRVILLLYTESLLLYINSLSLGTLTNTDALRVPHSALYDCTSPVTSKWYRSLLVPVGRKQYPRIPRVASDTAPKITSPPLCFWHLVIGLFLDWVFHTRNSKTSSAFWH